MDRKEVANKFNKLQMAINNTDIPDGWRTYLLKLLQELRSEVNKTI